MSPGAFLQASARRALRTARPMQRWLGRMLPLALPAALLVWELAVHAARVPVYLVPPPSRILAVLWTERAFYLQAAWVTLGEAIAGLALGMGIALGLAVATTFYPPLERAVMPLVILLKAIPLVAIAPILTLWFGFGPIPKVLMTALLTFYPALVSWMTGLRAVDPAALELMQAWKASDWEVFRYLRWPSAWPYTFTVLKTAIPLAFIGAVVAEWTGASGGLGRAMWLAQTNLDMPRLFAAAMILAALSLTGYAIAAWGERRVIRWGA
ncbi:ABC transporter permease [Thermoflexus sp.]|uniref:ABC transporter permease n=1 Tax=Thermoflexus sp. TaxID=1969742 RepID=UPI0025E73D56|nr:ABC transporter permease [Thermoflexus sp.]MCS6962594.1 ABC transporter permease [Thermoflexus sp.]MCX7690194.1 ABC transporter permease [Thermoflexus sp.]MDW8064076.1 ABC transporter permease [Anaerolineae bacterium]MDW8183730.1 ABC transporter permease [Anaerolineae bacterium]